MSNIKINTYNPLVPLYDEIEHEVDFGIYITQSLISSGFLNNYHELITIRDNDVYVYEGTEDEENVPIGGWIVFMMKEQKLVVFTNAALTTFYKKRGEIKETSFTSFDDHLVQHYADFTWHPVVLDSLLYELSSTSVYVPTEIETASILDIDLLDILGNTLGWLVNSVNHVGAFIVGCFELLWSFITD